MTISRWFGRVAVVTGTRMSISRWSGRVAVVTGASAGIGAATAIELARNGLITIGLARRVEKVEELRSQLTPEQQQNFHAMKCDVSVESEIIQVFDEIVNKFGGVDVLINNAAVVTQKKLIDFDNSSEVQKLINTNLLGAINCTREVVKSLRERNAEGHIIHINSVYGHFMPYYPDRPTVGIYTTSKFALTAMAEQQRQEFMSENLNIKVTSLSPGLVETEIMQTIQGMTKEMIEGFYEMTPHMESKDIADAIIYLLSTPQHVLITELTIRPMNGIF
ncbi:hypothetical protein PVAND_000522 [Polypedilum vanderplanki]|uniref:Dehydrogenase n=1 Tax=Polypedilum vanderplanki TaxID=319348 RepID=A0A9J6BKD4_POLVA|nr:hypothetical protein PVAND_000522 [Polypedilum vanderplanki]